jgi:D-beta-D-heptose 7-phosphate kinase/D-beta-D-heptose 1-phosphate adenosyltransferase
MKPNITSDWSQLRSAIWNSWGCLRVLVVGDIMLDQTISGEVERISPEAPVPVVRMTGRSHRPGGAANVAMNIAALGASAILLGYAGKDEEADLLASALEATGVEAHIVRVPDRPTTVKLRILSGHQQLLRVDTETTEPAPPEYSSIVLRQALDLLPSVHAVVLSDYAKGALDPELCTALIDAARTHGVPVVVDPKQSDFSRYRGATTICPNLRDLARLPHRSSHEHDLLADAARLVSELEIDFLTVTLSEKGIAVVSARGVERYPAMARQVFDVSGAGDTVVASLALCLASGMPVETAARLANRAAGIVVGKPGTAVVTRAELWAGLDEPPHTETNQRILTQQALQNTVHVWRSSGQRIVFTNGCFDLLHAGHIMLLEAARRMGDRLVVGLNSDASVRALKGPGRPVVPEQDRARLLAAFAAVDAVIVFDEPTPRSLIVGLRPDVLVKGGDYSEDSIVGASEVRSWGGVIAIVPLLQGLSTTSLIEGLTERPL